MNVLNFLFNQELYSFKLLLLDLYYNCSYIPLDKDWDLIGFKVAGDPYSVFSVFVEQDDVGSRSDIIFPGVVALSACIDSTELHSFLVQFCVLRQVGEVILVFLRVFAQWVKEYDHRPLLTSIQNFVPIPVVQLSDIRQYVISAQTDR